MFRTEPLASKPWRSVGALVAAAALAVGCGGGGTDEAGAPPTPVFDARSVTQSVGTAGGSVVLTAADGTGYRLTLPAGALGAATSITLASTEPAEGARAAVELAPASLRLAQPATLTITPPAGAPFGANASVRLAGAPMPLTAAAAGAIEVSLPMLPGGDTPAARAFAATSGRVQAQATRRIVCGVVTRGANQGAVLDIEDLANGMDLGTLHQCVVQSAAALERAGQYEQAIVLNLATAAFMQRVGIDTGATDVPRLLDDAKREVCLRRNQALDFVRIHPVSGIDEQVRLSKLLLWWEKQASLLGAQCGASAGDYAELLTTKAGELAAHVQTRRASLAQPGSSDHAEGLRAGARLAGMGDELRALRPASPTIDENLARNVFENQVEAGLVDAMLDGPWRSCRDSGDYAPLRALVDAFGGIARVGGRVNRALHYCGATLGAASRRADNSALQTLAQALGGVDARNTVEQGTLAVAKGGTLRLSGPIGRLQCAQGVQSAEALVIEVNGVELRRDATAPYLGSALELGIDQLIATAGADPATVRTLTLTLRREGDACGGAWGAHRAPLLTLELSFDRQSQVATGTGTGTLTNSCGTNATVPVTITAILLATGEGSVTPLRAVPYSGGSGTFTGDFSTSASITIVNTPFDGASGVTNVTVTPTTISGSMHFINLTTAACDETQGGTFFARIEFSVPRE